MCNLKEYTYIKFDIPASENTKTISKTNGILQKLIVGALSSFIPKANPDYDSLIGKVSEWLLEINADDNKPNREIGIDKGGQTIMILPWRDNYGYWSDNEITLDYFKEHFKAININKLTFETIWDAFIIQNSLSENYAFDKRGFSKYYRYLEQHGWQYDGVMTFTKGKERIHFDTSECFYIERIDGGIRKEFQCKSMAHFSGVIENNTSQ